jgi:hypothetical protein
MLDPLLVSQTLDTSLAETLETLAFLSVSRDDGTMGDPPDPTTGDWSWTRLSLTEPLMGDLVLIASTKSAWDLTASILGQMGADSGEWHIRDALGEVLNTIAGRFLATLRPNENITIGLPTVGTSWPDHVTHHQQNIYRDENGKPFILMWRVIE